MSRARFVVSQRYMRNMDDMDVSTAFTLIRELCQLKRITEDESAAFELKLRTLQESCITAKEKEKALLKNVRRQQNDALGEQLKVERAQETLDADLRQLKIMETECESVQKQLVDAEHREHTDKYEVIELVRTQEKLLAAVNEASKENDMLVKPELIRLERDVKITQETLNRVDHVYENDVERKKSLQARADMLEADVSACNMKLQDAREILQKTSIEPERVRKQAEGVQKALEKVNKEMGYIVDERVTCDKEITCQVLKRKQADEVKRNLIHKLELHQDTIMHRQRDVDTVKTNVKLEKARRDQLAEASISLEINRKAVDDRMQRETENISIIKKQLEILRRRYQKKQSIFSAANEIIPKLKVQLADREQLLLTHVEKNRHYVVDIDSIKQEVDVSIAQLLRQEAVEKSKREEVELLLKEVASMEVEIDKWSEEERRQNKLIAVLTAQREMKAREVARIKAAQQDAQEQVRVNELVILDLSKKFSEVNNRLKEFSALYDVVKNERNKYVSLTQSSSQAHAEMKEKTKILMDEVEILRNESFAKDKASAKEHLQHLASQSQRDGLRLALFRAQSEYQKRQELVKRNIIETEKQNYVINSLERDMLKLKAQYINAVEMRNATGVTLIDRNDELCILYEKINLQEQTIRRGLLGARQAEEDVRMLKLRSAELKRQMAVSNKQLPQKSTFADKVLKLKHDLKSARQTTESLCGQLESPSNSKRWCRLSGEDPERDQLLAKTTMLEEQLKLKKEALLENDLILEEISNLIAKHKRNYQGAEKSALDLACKVNNFQAKIREASKRMMAIVSELSMYQCTAMRLQQQKRMAKSRLEEAIWRVKNGEPPTEEACTELLRCQLMKRATRPTCDQPSRAVRTKAIPRPNAYIPEASQGMGIPKPYSSMAPFKPTEAGSTMRHYRKPKPLEISL